MSRFPAVARGVAQALAAERVGFAMVGGFAVSARTEPRNTRDLDFAVAVGSDQESEQIVRSLLRRGYRNLALLEQEEVHRLATVRLAAPGTEPDVLIVDLLFASCGIEPEVVAQATDIAVWPDLTLPVACLGHLVAMKLLSRNDARRPQDRADLAALIRNAQPADLEAARNAARLIGQRGFSRGRDLVAELDRTLVEFGDG